MTHADWMTILNTALVVLLPTLVALATGAITGVTGRISAWLDAKGQHALSGVVTDANARLQDAMENAAGRLRLRAQAGTLDLTDLAALKREALAEATSIRAKLPDAVRAAQPVADALAEGILGKVMPKAVVVPVNDPEMAGRAA